MAKTFKIELTKAEIDLLASALNTARHALTERANITGDIQLITTASSFSPLRDKVMSVLI